MKKLSKQSGAVLLVLMLVLIVGSSYMLVTSLNANVVTQIDSEETYSVLNQAKQALIAYAVTVPETSATIIPELAVLTGPGYLPCPDTDNDGNADCGAGAVVGRLPYVTLGEEALVDGIGASLWYALDANYMDLGPPAAFLNSETVGQLSIDGQGDIVAIIFAPGNSLTGQQRELAVNNIANYLENDNQDGDLSFVSALPGVDPNILIGTFNDKVIALTRQELMSVVEKRVLSEVSQGLEGFRNSFPAVTQAYPWLAPFANPAASTFAGQINTWAGHLPVHLPGQVFTDNPVTPLTWAIPLGGTFLFAVGLGPAPLEACVRNSNCAGGGLYGPLPNPLPLTCTWQDRNTFNCSAQINYGPAPGATRTYTMAYTDTGANVIFTAPTALTNRTRNVNLNGVLAVAQPLMILVIDRTADGALIGSAALRFNAGVNVNMNITGVDYRIDTAGVDLNADGDANDAGEAGELPTWFVNNNWHQLVYAAYPVSEPLPGVQNPAPFNPPAAGVCNGNCLTLTSNGISPVNNIRAVAMIAGQDLTPATIHPNAVLIDYFDLINSDAFPNTFDQQLPSTVFNDQVRIIRTVTTP